MLIIILFTLYLFILLLIFEVCQSYKLPFIRNTLLTIISKSSYSINVVPLELTGKLDPSETWPVTFIFNGVEKIVQVCEDTSFLEASEKVFVDAPYSCRNGVCITCSAKVLEGRSNVLLAVHGLGEPQIEAGYICTCQAFAKGPGIVVQMGAYDEVYETQYGQYERSYESKNKPVETKKNLFGF